MGDHFVNVCQYGYTHGQCRCASPNKSIRRVECNQVKHAQNPKPGKHMQNPPGKHGVEYTAPPDAPVTLRFHGGDVDLDVGPFPSRRDADEWYTLAAAMVAESSGDFTVLTSPDDAMDTLRRVAGWYTAEDPVDLFVLVPDETPASTRRFDTTAIESMVGQEFPVSEGLGRRPTRVRAKVAEAHQTDDGVQLRLRITGPIRSVDALVTEWREVDPEVRMALGFVAKTLTDTHYVGAVHLVEGSRYGRRPAVQKPPRLR